MKRTLCSTAVAAVFAFGGTAFAAGQGQQQSEQQQQDQQAQQQSSGSSMTDPVKKQTFSALDRDDDGTLSMMEAAADPDAKQQFKELDSNNDYQLSRSEYERLEEVSQETVGGGGAAAGGSAQGEQEKSWVDKSQQTYEERTK